MSTMRTEHAARAERGKLFLRMQREISAAETSLATAQTERDELAKDRAAFLELIATLEAKINTLEAAAKAPADPQTSESTA